jgi:2-C-methyl-D-erythritol 4-phosphate cytidylyltransferase
LKEIMTSNHTTSAAAIVAAGGSGKRMGGVVPKQLLEIRHKPILVHTLEKLGRVPDILFIVVAVPAALVETVIRLLPEWNIPKSVRVVEGGVERQDSVRRALRVLPDEADPVLVHDAVRPFISVHKIREVLSAAERHGSAILALRAKNTIKRGRGDWVEETMDRNALWETQTPQAFRRDILVRAYEKAEADGFSATDDSQLVERLGHPVRIVTGEETNIKITSPADLRLAEILAKEESCE